jgi:DnaK suppressor protein
MAAKPKTTAEAKAKAKTPKAKTTTTEANKAGTSVAKAKAKSAIKPKTAAASKTSAPVKSPAKKVAKDNVAVTAKSGKVSKTKPKPKTPAKSKILSKSKPAAKTSVKATSQKKTPQPNNVSGTSSPNNQKIAPKTVKSADKNTTRDAKREKTVKEPSTVDSKSATPKSTTTKPAAKKSSATKAAATGKAKAVKKNIDRIDSQPEFTPYTRKKNEDYMNEEQRDHFKQILLDWKLQLMTEVDRTVNHMKDVAANDPDPADRATQEEEFSLELRTRDRERKLIRKIDSTIDLIDQDDYGYCESCGIEVGIQRLEARPTATQCIDCKTLDEIKERQIHG